MYTCPAKARTAGRLISTLRSLPAAQSTHWPSARACLAAAARSLAACLVVTMPTQWGGEWNPCVRHAKERKSKGIFESNAIDVFLPKLEWRFFGIFLFYYFLFFSISSFLLSFFRFLPLPIWRNPLRMGGGLWHINDPVRVGCWRGAVLFLLMRWDLARPSRLCWPPGP